MAEPTGYIDAYTCDKHKQNFPVDVFKGFAVCTAINDLWKNSYERLCSHLKRITFHSLTSI